MLRHFQLIAPAPGREAEVEQALCRWLEEVQTAAGIWGGAVLREYAGEFGEIVGALAVMYDVESREAGAEYRRATAHIRKPMSQDVPGDEPADQGEIIFRSAHGHAHGSNDHGHHHEAHDGERLVETLRYDRGGGLLARLMHGHFTIQAVSSRAAAPAASSEI